jgi:two-component system response regulator PilR (NtrC family)
VARAIHQNSERRNFPFVVVNSGTLPPDLLESHLFGHVKGAFTGAVSQKAGLFETADRGSIFFDEISTVGFETQAKLLRVMQDKEFMRLGARRRSGWTPGSSPPPIPTWKSSSNGRPSVRTFLPA